MSDDSRPLDAPMAELLERIARDLRAGSLSVVNAVTSEEGRLRIQMELVSGVSVEPIDVSPPAPAPTMRMCPSCQSTNLFESDPKKPDQRLCLKCNTVFDLEPGPART